MIYWCEAQQKHSKRTLINFFLHIWFSMSDSHFHNEFYVNLICTEFMYFPFMCDMHVYNACCSLSLIKFFIWRETMRSLIVMTNIYCKRYLRWHTIPYNVWKIDCVTNIKHWNLKEICIAWCISRYTCMILNVMHYWSWNYAIIQDDHYNYCVFENIAVWLQFNTKYADLWEPCQESLINPSKLIKNTSLFKY